MKIKCKKNYEDYVIRAKKKIDEVLNFLGINLQQALNGEFESVQVKKDIGRPFKSEFQRTNIPYPRGLSKEWYNQIRDLERKENYANKKNKTLTAQWGTKGPKMPTWNNTEIERKKSTPKKWNKKILNIPQSKEKENPIDTEVEISSLLDSCVTINSESIKNQEIGSGFFFGENSILTCYHVAFPNKDENSKITIRHKGKDYKATSSVKNQNLDIAVLHIIDDPNFKSSKYLNLGKSRNIVQGEKIFIIGTPLGYENVVGEGIVSSTPIDYTDYGISKKYILISTNINPGNSGGPVIKESDGTVIGIAAAVITAEKTENSGLNAAIPIDDINLAIQNNFVHPEA
jgi:S1-C subfamily serine protease